MKKKKFLSLAIFVAGLCSIIYELLVSTTATYFLGDGVRQFSLIVGVYLFSMGVGAYMAKYFAEKPLRNFIYVEYLLGIIGGISVPLLYFLFTSISISAFQLSCLGIIFFIGFLTGLEIPLLTFSIQSDDLKEDLSLVLSLDYVGGLVATLLFPFFILPFVGLFYASLVFGLVNILLGLMLSFMFFRDHIRSHIAGLLGAAFTIGLVMLGGQLLQVWEQKIYKSPIIYNEHTPYQKIVMTKRGDNTKLFLNRVIQFASADEHRYHESIIHVPLAIRNDVKRVLVLGGGENLATRELVKHPQIKSIDIVDIDSTMFNLSMRHEVLSKINDLAPFDPRVHMIVDDAFSFLYNNVEKYDLIVADLPDPNSQSLARLYSKQFFGLAKRNLVEGGVFITQSGDINNSQSVFSCIHNTMKEVFTDHEIIPFHVYIPSFGDWGFNIASPQHNTPIDPNMLPDGLKYLDSMTLSQGLYLPKDLQILDTKVSTLDNPHVLQYFLDDFQKFKENSL